MRNEAQFLAQVESNPNSNKEAARILVRLVNKVQSKVSLRDMVVNRFDDDADFASFWIRLMSLMDIALAKKPVDESLLTPEAEANLESDIDAFLLRAEKVLAK